MATSHTHCLSVPRTLFGAIIVAALGAFFAGGCKKVPATPGPAGAQTTKATILLDWKPEPEFGGFYAGKLTDVFGKHGIDIDLAVGGESVATWQRVDRGDVDFATTSADQLLIARAQGADVVAVFAVYQTSPQGVMVHKARGFSTMKDVFTHPGTLAAEPDVWLKFLLKKYGPGQVQLTAYAGGVATFLAKPDYSQQCFVTSEPLIAKSNGGDPQAFLASDEGFNPYTTMLITRGKTLREKPQYVKAVVDSCREGWRKYLDDPKATNAAMEKLNTEMSPQIFDEGAAAQKPFIETEETKKSGLGTMTAERWKTLAQQL
ncbi:MAG: hydroxymethylpyrimidine transporter substrate-binding protein, partial [Phycisphaerales bacterium]|nr:hydroxymethylpyrimidine transporter substrate-binding protein [Phycisphaerales bacterium]